MMVLRGTDRPAALIERGALTAWVMGITGSPVPGMVSQTPPRPYRTGGT